MTKNRVSQRTAVLSIGLLFILLSALICLAIPTLDKPCHLVSAFASADGTKIYLQTEPPRFGQIEHRYELDLKSGTWTKLHWNEVLCVSHLHRGAPVIRANKSDLDTRGIPLFRRWFHVPDDAMATDSPTLRMELWFRKLRWSQTWQEFDRFEMREYQDLTQTEATGRPFPFAEDLIRSRDGSRLVVCRFSNSGDRQFELWADDADQAVLARWKCRSLAVDDDANQLAILVVGSSGERRVQIHSLHDGERVAEFSLEHVGSAAKIVNFSARARRLLVSDKQSVYLVDYETGFRVPFQNGPRSRTTESFRLRGRHVMTETQIFDAEDGKLLFKDDSPIFTFRMMLGDSDQFAEVVKSVAATGPGRALVAARFLSGEVHIRNLKDNSMDRQCKAPTEINAWDIAVMVCFALWSVAWVAYSRWAFAKQGFVICMIFYFAILLSLAVYRLENAGLVTQFDRPVKWLLAGLLLGTGTQTVLWLWSGQTRFWLRSVLAGLHCCAAIVVAKDRVFTRLSSTLDCMLAAVWLVLIALLCVSLFIGMRWCYGRWFRLHLEARTHFSILNLFICIAMASFVMTVLLPYRKTLLGSMVLEPPALHAMLYASGAAPLALMLRQLRPSLTGEAIVAFCLVASGAIAARLLFGEFTLSNADPLLGFAGFHGAWVLSAVTCYGQDYRPSAHPISAETLAC